MVGYLQHLCLPYAVFFHFCPLPIRPLKLQKTALPFPAHIACQKHTEISVAYPKHQRMFIAVFLLFADTCPGGKLCCRIQTKNLKPPPFKPVSPLHPVNGSTLRQGSPAQSVIDLLSLSPAGKNQIFYCNIAFFHQIHQAAYIVLIPMADNGIIHFGYSLAFQKRLKPVFSKLFLVCTASVHQNGSSFCADADPVSLPHIQKADLHAQKGYTHHKNRSYHQKKNMKAPVPTFPYSCRSRQNPIIQPNLPAGGPPGYQNTSGNRLPNPAEKFIKI